MRQWPTADSVRHPVPRLRAPPSDFLDLRQIRVEIVVIFKGWRRIAFRPFNRERLCFKSVDPSGDGGNEGRVGHRYDSSGVGDLAPVERCLWGAIISPLQRLGFVRIQVASNRGRWGGAGTLSAPFTRSFILSPIVVAGVAAASIALRVSCRSSATSHFVVASMHLGSCAVIFALVMRIYC